MATRALPVINAETANRYYGAEVTDYDARRVRQDKWRREFDVLETMLTGRALGVVLDIPVGTGRFIPLYRRFGFKSIMGGDVSTDMLNAARKYAGKDLGLFQTDILDIKMHGREVDCAVCIRLLNLLSEQEMQRAVSELCRVANDHVILSIRLGNELKRRSLSVTHTYDAFMVAIPEEWTQEGEIDLGDGGYRMVLLKRIGS